MSSLANITRSALSGTADVGQRITERVRVTSRECWEWQGAINSKGYGQLSINGTSKSVHRVSYTLVNGPLAEGIEIDHLCRNRTCCNPRHLEAVTRLDHASRSIEARKTYCLRGHAYTPENTIVKKRGSGRGEIRNCRTCSRDAQRRIRETKKATSYVVA